jgi:apolipoprotein N-acyltransferase
MTMKLSRVSDDRSEFPRDLLDLLVPLFGGTHLGWCFHSPAIAWTAPLGLGAIAYAARISSRSLATLSAFAGLFVFHLIGLRFLQQTGHREVGLWWPWLSAALAAVSLCYLPVTRWFVNHLHLNFVWAFPIAWVASEQLRFWATVPFLEVPFPFLRVGTTLYQSGYLLQCADLVGEGGLSGLAALFAAAAADWLRQAARPIEALHHVLRRTLKIGLIGMVLLGYGVAWELRARNEPGPVVGLIPDLFPIDVIHDDARMAEFADRLAKLQSEAGEGCVDLWVWSEMSLAMPLEPNGQTDVDREHWERLQSLSRRVGSSLLIGAPRLSSNARHNSCFLVSPAGEAPQFYDKSFLGPADEFQPRLGKIMSALTGRPHLAPQSLNWAVHSPGDATPVFSVPSVRESRRRFAGCSICFDVWFATLFCRYMQQPEGPLPDFLVNIADEVFTGDREFSYAHWALVQARLRAIETRRPLVRCCGDGYTAIVAPTGRILALQGGPATSKSVLIGQVPVSTAFSLYSLTGDVLPICSLLVSAAALLKVGTSRLGLRWKRPVVECRKPLGLE